MYATMAFLEAKTALDSGGRLTASELYDAYVSWHPREGGPAVKRRTFIAEVRELYNSYPVMYGVHHFAERGSSARGFKGLSLAKGREALKGRDAIATAFRILETATQTHEDGGFCRDADVVKDLLLSADRNPWSRATARSLLDEWEEYYPELGTVISLL